MVNSMPGDAVAPIPIMVEDGGTAPAPTRLGRSLASRHIAMIAIGGIIGAGLFVGSSASIAAVGPAVIISYGLAGGIVLLVMRMLSEMALAAPGTQSFQDFARLGLGPWAGFVTGWLYWYFWVIVVAIEAIAGGVILSHWIALPTWELGVGLLAILTGVNLFSARSYGEFEFWLSSLKVAAILAFILLTGAYVLGLGGVVGLGAPGTHFANLTAHGGFMPNGVTSVLAGTTSVIFALVGAEIATIAAAESAEPAAAVAKMTSSVALRILVFYVLSIALIVAVVPWTDIHPGVSPFGTALTALNVPAVGTIMNVIVLVAVLSCLNSGLYVTSRVLFSLAAHGDAPRALVPLSRRAVPTRAILIASSFGYLALAASVLSPEKVFSFLANASGVIMLIVYVLIAAAQIRLRRRIERTDPHRLSVRMWLFPWLSYATIAAMALIMAAMALTPDLSSQFWSSMALTGVVLAAFFLFRRGRTARAR